jgi:hypothetical protein
MHDAIEQFFCEKGLDYVIGTSDDCTDYNCAGEPDTHYLGMSVKGKGGKREAKKNPDELKRIADLVKQYVPDDDCDFYNGYYAS